MNDLIIEPTKKSLEIKCVPGEIRFSGNSILQDAKKFFDPVIKWTQEYVNSPEVYTLVDLKLHYVDTASVQRIFEMLEVLKKIKNSENEIVVNWHYEMDDPELLELGEIMDGRLGLEFNFIEYSEE